MTTLTQLATDLLAVIRAAHELVDNRQAYGTMQNYNYVVQHDDMKALSDALAKLPDTPNHTARSQPLTNDLGEPWPTTSQQDRVMSVKEAADMAGINIAALKEDSKNSFMELAEELESVKYESVRPLSKHSYTDVLVARNKRLDELEEKLLEVGKPFSVAAIAVLAEQNRLVRKTHDLYTSADPNKPSMICDANGEVELSEPCNPMPSKHSYADVLVALNAVKDVHGIPFAIDIMMRKSNGASKVIDVHQHYFDSIVEECDRVMKVPK